MVWILNVFDNMAAILFRFQMVCLAFEPSFENGTKTIRKWNKMAAILCLNLPYTELENVRYWDGVSFVAFGIKALTVYKTKMPGES